MTAAERGFLLLTSHLGDANRHPLTLPQLRELSRRVSQGSRSREDRDLSQEDLLALGYRQDMAQRILGLLSQEDLLDYYISRGKKLGCIPLTRISPGFPVRLRDRLGMDCPGCLWAKGDLSILKLPAVSVVGSRELRPENREFARQVGHQAALQGYALVSGNARGADKTAQEACLQAGGYVISIVADSMAQQPGHERVLYLSEDGYEEAFTSWRALSRNRLIHSIGSHSFVAQCNLGTGGTWDGTVRNLRSRWTPVFCMADGSPAVVQLYQMGAGLIRLEDLADFSQLQPGELNFLDP